MAGQPGATLKLARENRRKATKYLCFIAGMSAAIGACSRPDPPALPELSSTRDPSQGQIQESQQNPLPAASADVQQPTQLQFGANVGTAEEKLAVNQCNQQGKFFDRQQRICDTAVAIVTGLNCSRVGVISGANLSEERVAELDGYLNGDLAGYQFDQCVNLSATEIRVFFAKQDPAGIITLRTMTVVRS